METQQPRGVIEYRTHYAWAAIIATIFSLILVSRLFTLQILRGEEYEQRSRIDHVGRSRTPARRGVVKDRHGVVLAENVSEHSLSVVPHYLERYPATLPHLRELLGLTDKEYRDIGRRVQRATTRRRRFNRITVMRNIVSDRCPVDGAGLELSDARDYLWCPACGARYEQLGRDQRQCRYCRRQALEFRHDGRVGTCPRCGTTYALDPRCPEDGGALELRTAALECPICGRPHDDQEAVVRSHLHELPGLSIETEMRRRYPERFRFGHLLGYVNEVNVKDLKQFPGLYRRGDYIGRSGLERGLEAVLRGEPGETVYLRDERGRRQLSVDLGSAFANLHSRPAVPGFDVWLTVDTSVQKIVERALRYHPSAAAVVTEVHTGRILALYSKPGFDPNVWSGRLTREAKAEYDANPYAPMINKALTAYPPGSVWKVVTAVAGLREGLIDEQTTFHCPGYYEFGGRRFRCHDRSGHGDENLVEALKDSCDVYFYKLGEMLGMERLERYAREFFEFGMPTGVEVAERTGRVPSKAWHRKHSRIGWQPGFTLSTAVGQGAVLASPLQVARAYGALANGGQLLKARLVLQYEGPDGAIERRFMPEVTHTLDVDPAHLRTIHEGLVAAVNEEDGTARAGRVADFVVAGKTGTAEARQVKKGASPELAEWLLRDHAWYAAYAPAEDPQIVVVVFVEHGGSGGKIAAPVARRIIEQYFRQGFGQLPEPDAAVRGVSDPTEDLDGIR